MKALVFHGDNDLRYEERPLPACGPGEALVKVRAVGICGSDVQGYLGKTGRRTPPMVMGHEFAGEVAAVGPAVGRFKAGDRVVVFPYAICDRCACCRGGLTNICPEKKFFGVFSQDGAMAEYVCAAEDLLYPLPAGLDFAHGALAEPLSVAARCVEKAGIVPGRPVAVVGAGTIGLMCLLLAKLKGATPLVAVDLDDGRLGVARRLGADLTVNPSREDVAAAVGQRLGGGADIVIEAVGVEATLAQAVALAARGGRVAVVGMAQRHIAVDMHQLIGKEVDIVTSFNYDRRQFEDVLASLPALKSGLDEIISLRAPLAQGVGLYRRLAAGEAGLLKVILTD